MITKYGRALDPVVTGEPDSPIKAFKRSRVPDNWNKNVVKKMRQSGQAIETPTSSKPAREVKGRCSIKCKFYCKQTNAVRYLSCIGGCKILMKNGITYLSK